MNNTLISQWSWGHQGVYVDKDGSLINANTFGTDLLTTIGLPLSGEIGASWHSAVDNDMFNPKECVYIRNRTESNNGAICRASLKFRRIQIKEHKPDANRYRPLLVTTYGGSGTAGSFPTTAGGAPYNGTSIVYFSHYNDDGYQFTYPVRRDAYLHWDNTIRLDPAQVLFHRPDPMTAEDWFTMTTRHVQREYQFKVWVGAYVAGCV